MDKPYSSVLFDTNKELMSARIAADGQWRFPDELQIPDKFKTCLIMFEDEYFFYHPGVNPASLFKSLKRNLSSGKIRSGGSTITMQLARMIQGNKKRSYLQKLIEILLAFRIEISYRKESILRIYANNAPYGSNVVGLTAASWRYFGRSPDKLSWAESALLAVLPNAPSLMFPGKNQNKLLLKRNFLLKKLFLNGTIDKATYQLSLHEALPAKAYQLPQLAPHLLNQLIKEHGSGKIFYSTLHKNIQEKVNSIVSKHISRLSSNGIHNACALVADVETNEVIAYIGNSSSEKNEHDNYVDIIRSSRSTGSILKPFLYAFMLNEHKILPKSLLEDVPTQIGSYGPENFFKSYDGLVPAHEALARSLNVPAVKMLQQYSTNAFHERLKQLGFTTFTKPSSHYGLSLILGGGEASLFEIASAYTSLARLLNTYNNQFNTYRKHNFMPLKCLTDNHINEDGYIKQDLLKASSVWFMFNAMTELVRPQDYTGWAQFRSRKRIAWKTGTSFGFRDAWAVGTNARYVVAAWVGNADGEGRPELTGTSCAAPLMFDVFNTLPASAWFNKPYKNLSKIKVCETSGFKASDVCPNTGWSEVQEGGEKTPVCPFHKLIYMNQELTHRVNSECYPVSNMKSIAWFIASPAQEYFLRQSNAAYKPLPPWLPQCNSDLNFKQLELLYPRDHFKLYTPLNEKGEQKGFIFKAAHHNKQAVIFWYIDKSFIGSTTDFHQISVKPSAGKHELLLTDSEGERIEIKFEVLEK